MPRGQVTSNLAYCACNDGHEENDNYSCYHSAIEFLDSYYWPFCSRMPFVETSS